MVSFVIHLATDCLFDRDNMHKTYIAPEKAYLCLKFNQTFSVRSTTCNNNFSNCVVVGFGTALESNRLSRICEQDETMAFLPKSVFPPIDIYPKAPEDGLSKEFPVEENIQLELPVETVTAPTPQSHESGRVDENLVGTKLLVEPWNELPDIPFASPGGRGRQGPGVTSVVGPQTPTDWLYEAESTKALVSPPPPPPPTDSPLPDEGCSQPLDPGPCRQYVVKWYYDPEANACAQFWFGGCQVNGNNFETEASCRNSCVYT
ncbi:formin-like protein 1 [Centropristis striata]|uniref:formin-like protein 1 n=1 Tax=Centropristis striata TaxID=184440 RepID=UPI0027DEE9C0|nr:formin-like protein 1 [Centropristis striata]